MIAAPYFTVDMFELKEPQQFSTVVSSDDGTEKTSVQILTAIDGCGVVESQGRDPVTFTKGDAVVIPASVRDFTVRPQWQLEFFKASVPGRDGSPSPPHDNKPAATKCGWPKKSYE